MTLITRATKGSPLTHNEQDGNLEYLETSVTDLKVTVDALELDNNTNNITEGSDNSVGDGTNNLFYTDERVLTYLTDNSYAVETWVTNQITTLTGTVTELTTTDGITEGTNNLYYTEERARSAISVDGNLSYDPVTGVISYTDLITIEWDSVENKPTTVSGYGITDTYTKSETDSAITDRVTEIASGEINLTGYATETYADATIDSKSTTDLSEGSSNLYYTEDRVQTYLTDNNYATKLYVTSTVNDIIYQETFADVATSGSYTDLTDTPTDISTFTNDSNLITLESISVTGDLAYDNTTGIISYVMPTDISTFTNDAEYLVDSDLDSIRTRLDVVETPVYTILDVFKHMYAGTELDEQYIHFSIRAVDQFRYAWLSSGQSDPDWDTLVDAIYDTDISAISSAFLNITNASEQSVFLFPFLSLINADITVINEIEGTTYDTMTFAELLDIPEWESRNTGLEASALAVRNQIDTTADEFIRALLKLNSYADFTRDTVVTDWNPV